MCNELKKKKKKNTPSFRRDSLIPPRPKRRVMSRNHQAVARNEIRETQPSLEFEEALDQGLQCRFACGNAPRTSPAAMLVTSTRRHDKEGRNVACLRRRDREVLMMSDEVMEGLLSSLWVPIKKEKTTGRRGPAGTKQSLKDSHNGHRYAYG